MMLLLAWAGIGLAGMGLIALIRMVSGSMARSNDRRNDYEYWRSVREAEVLSRSKGPLV